MKVSICEFSILDYCIQLNSIWVEFNTFMFYPLNDIACGVYVRKSGVMWMVENGVVVGMTRSKAIFVVD